MPSSDSTPYRPSWAEMIAATTASPSPDPLGPTPAAIEAVEHTGQLRRRDAAAVVDHLHPDGRSALFGDERDGRSLVKVPARLAGRDRLGFRWAALDAEQQQCLADVNLTRPVGRLTETQRAALRQSKLDAAKACGIGG